MNNYRSPLVRVSRRILRFNLSHDYKDGHASIDINKFVYGRKIKYSCEKCNTSFTTWKALHEHKVENHSY